MNLTENKDVQEELWSIADVCAALGISYSTLNRWRYHMKDINFPLPVYNITNRNIMFLKQDIIGQKNNNFRTIGN